MDRVVRAFPILPGKEDALREFARELESNPERAAALYGRYGIHRETWHLQHTEHGAVVIAVTEASELAKAAEDYGASEDEGDRWFKDSVREVTGIDPDSQPLGPPTQPIFDWRANA